MKGNVVRSRSFAFALRIVKLARYLQGEKKEFVLSKQILRSGTAVGALIREAEHADSDELVRLLVSIVKTSKDSPSQPDPDSL